MIAAVDIGNTLTKSAIFGVDGKLVAERSIATSLGPTGIELGFFARVERAVIGSVVPSATGAWRELLTDSVSLVHTASAASPWGFEIGVEEPTKVGVDRLAALEGALIYPGSVIVVDAGTATKFDLLEGVEVRTFPGGAIAPGMEISYEALLASAAQLARIELKKHSPVLGYNTETAIRSGVVHGFAAQVDGMILRIFEERKLPSSTVVVATGGNSPYLQGRARLITQYRPRLTLEGLHAIAKKI